MTKSKGNCLHHLEAAGWPTIVPECGMKSFEFVMTADKTWRNYKAGDEVRELGKQMELQVCDLTLMQEEMGDAIDETEVAGIKSTIAMVEAMVWSVKVMRGLDKHAKEESKLGRFANTYKKNLDDVPLPIHLSKVPAPQAAKVRELAL